MHFEKDNTFQTKIEIVSDRIRESILNGTLEPRERILIKNIAESLGFSIIPVREAIRKLEVEGFLDIVPHKGVYVREPDLYELSDIFEVRILLESHAARLATKKIDDFDSSGLWAIIEEMETLSKELDKSSILKYFRLNRKFHGMLYEGCGNSFLCEKIEGIALNIEPHLLRYISSADSRKIAQKQHEKILRAFQERNAQLVEDLIVDHLTNIFSIIMKLTPKSSAEAGVKFA